MAIWRLGKADVTKYKILKKARSSDDTLEYTLRPGRRVDNFDRGRIRLQFGRRVRDHSCPGRSGFGPCACSSARAIFGAEAVGLTPGDDH